jgi:hypothetical protein
MLGLDVGQVNEGEQVSHELKPQLALHPHITHQTWVKNSLPWLSDIAAGRLLFTRLAGGDRGVAVWRHPTCGRGPRGSPADPALACPSVWHCSSCGSSAAAPFSLGFQSGSHDIPQWSGPHKVKGITGNKRKGLAGCRL